MPTINGTNYDDTLYGGGAADTIRGLNGHDVLKGGGGADILDGGAGYDSAMYNDSFVGVGINLATGHGYGGTAEGDTLLGIERLYGSNFNDSFIGTAEYNEFYGFAGNDYLDGAEGPDHLEGSFGADFMKGGGGDDFLDGGDDGDTLNGGTGADILVGGGGDDSLAGGDGADVLEGGDGIDTVDYSGSGLYVSADLSGNPLNLGRGGAEGDTYAHIENLTGSIYADQLYGNDTSNRLSGGDGDDALYGQGGADILIGGNGNDFLYAGVVTTVPIHGFAGTSWLGGAADDVFTPTEVLAGGPGQDNYIVEDVGDLVVELAGEGTDLVESLISYQLPANVEELRLVAVGPMNGTGNELDNKIIGNDAFNILDGKGGADLMGGRGGDDWYFVDNTLDSVREFAGYGADRVFASVDYYLRAGEEVETLSTTSTPGLSNLTLIGNELANSVIGNAGSNAIKGLAGNDLLYGGGGIDAFVFNTALAAATNVDRILDFSVVDDDIILARGIFTALPTGTLTPGAFRVGAAAADADDRIIYDSTTGALLYDFDGIGSGAAVPFASMSAGLALTNADFIIV